MGWSGWARRRCGVLGSVLLVGVLLASVVWFGVPASAQTDAALAQARGGGGGGGGGVSLEGFDAGGRSVEVAALFESGGGVWFASSGWRGASSGRLVDGDVGLGAGDEPVVRVMRPWSSVLRLNDAGPLVMREFFGVGGEGSDYWVHVLTGDGTVVFPVGVPLSAGHNYVNFAIPERDRGVLGGIEAGDRFVFALTSPAPEEADEDDGDAVVGNDASLSALSLSEGALSPLFDADVIGYSADVAHGTARVTVDAVAGDSDASVNITPADADPDTAGHQVDVSAVVSVTVTAADGVAFRVYTVTVSRPPPPAISTDFGFRGVLGAASGLLGEQPLVGFSIRGGGLGSFTVTEVDDPERARNVGGRGFFTGLFWLPGTYALPAVGEFTDAVVWMTGRVSTPFEMVVNGRRYGSGSASVSNAPAHQDVFWVWEDPCAAWQDGAEVDVSYAVGVDSGAALGSADASLQQLSLTGAALGAEFAPATLDYSAALAPGASQVTVDAAAADPNACSVTISPADADPDADGHQIDVGDSTTPTTATVTVTAADSATTQTYTVAVARSADASLSELSLRGRSLVRSFDVGTASHVAKVGHDTRQITIDTTTDDDDATVDVVPADADPETDGHQVDLVVGETTVTVTITAADGVTVRVHTLKVSRQTAPPMEEITFELPEHCTLRSHGGDGWIPRQYWDRRNAPDYCHKRHPHYRSPNTYQDGYGAHFYRLVVEEPGEVRIKINSRWTRSVLAVWSASGELVASDGRAMNHRVDPDMTLTLERGQYVVEVGNAIINIGGERYRRYYELGVWGAGVVRSGDFDLLGLRVSGVDMAGFESGVYEYTRWVAADVSRVTVSGVPRRGDASVVVSPPDADAGTAGWQVDLDSDGETEIVVRAVPPDVVGPWLSYRVKLVTVPATTSPLAANDATLASLGLSGIDLGVFDPERLAWRHTLGSTVHVGGTTATLAVVPGHSGASWTATPSDADAVAAGHQVRVDTGAIVAVTVVSEDGRHSNTYTVVFDRASAPSDDAALGSLTVAEGSLGPRFDPAVSDYGASVPSTAASFTVAGAARHAGADVAITPADADAVAAGHQVSLSEGDNTATVTVTAEDGATTRAHTVTVARAASPGSDASLASLELSEGALAPAFDAGAASYAAQVAHDTARVTVHALAAVSDAAVTVSPADADPAAAGHQVDVASPAAGSLVPAVTTVAVSVTAPDGVTVGAYSVAVSRPVAPPPADPSVYVLDGIGVSGVDMTGFDPMVPQYRRSVAADVSTVTVTPSSQRADAVTRILPADADPGTDGHQVALGADGVAVITVDAGLASLVGPQQVYRITLTQIPGTTSPLSTDAALASLSLTGLDIGAFAADRTEYAYTLPHAWNFRQDNIVTLAAATADTDATWTATPADADPDTDGHQIDIAAMPDITVTVTAQDGVNQQHYTAAGAAAFTEAPPQGCALCASGSISPWSQIASTHSLGYLDGDFYVIHTDTKHQHVQAQGYRPGLFFETPAHKVLATYMDVYDASTGQRSRRVELDVPWYWRYRSKLPYYNDTWGPFATSFWTDGDTVWLMLNLRPNFVINDHRPAGHERYVLYSYSLETGKEISQTTLLTGPHFRYKWFGGLWSDGTTMYTTDALGKLVSYDLGTGTRLDSVQLEGYDVAPTTFPYSTYWSSGPQAKKRSLWSDGETLWTTNVDDTTVHAYDLHTGARRPGLDFDAPTRGGLASHGSTMWVTDIDNGRLLPYTMPANARLKTLGVAGADMDRFNSGVFAHTATVPATATTATITAQQAFTGGSASIAYDTPDADPDTDGHQVSLTTGTTTVTITVTAPNGADTETYTLTITRTP